MNTPPWEETEVTLRGSIADIVKAYEIAREEIKQAYEILANAEKRLKSAFNIKPGFDTDFGTLPGRWDHSNANANESDVLKNTLEIINRQAWKALYDMLEIDRVASINRRDEIEKKLEKGKLPEITLEIVITEFGALFNSINEFAKESVIEVYEWLRPDADHWEMKNYKTNQKNARYELGNKLIKPNMIRKKSFGSGFDINSYNEKYLIALDRVFHMLDGKNALQNTYRSPLVDTINTSEGSTCKTDYFYCKMYKNGNLHIEFTRPDLVQSFNAIAGGQNLKPNN